MTGKSFCFPLLFITLLLVSCGIDSRHFKLSGRLLNLNQGEFYVYSTDGIVSGIDTIKVQSGRFSYETRCESEGTLVIVFPNFSEQPVFAKAGKSVDIKGDASHLKELRVTGTAENKLMNLFRERIANVSPDEQKACAKQFINEYPNSIVANYLVSKYFIKAQEPDYVVAAELLDTMQKAQPNNGRLAQMAKQVEILKNTRIGRKLPKFTAVTIDGDTITERDFMKGDAVIYVWATWEFESLNVQRLLRDRREQDSLQLLGICLNTWKKDCEKTVEREKIETPVTCDELMFDGDLVKQLGFSTIPANILLKDGKIEARDISVKELRERFPQAPK